MKKRARELAAYYGCTAEYSGNLKVMFIRGDNHVDAIIAIKALHPPFMVVEENYRGK